MKVEYFPLNKFVYTILYSDPCLDAVGEDTLETFCDRVREQRCEIPDGCTSVVQPTDGCCPICG